MQASSSAIFVTGASGFIGRHLVSSLLHQGHRVRVSVRPGKGVDLRIPKGCEQVSVDITDIEKLVGIVAASSAVIYCAGSVRGRNPADFETANISGVETMTRAMALTPNTPPLLLLSSLAASKPQLSDYANSKFEGEKILHDMPSLPWTILRPPAVYGPYDRELLPLLKMIRRGWLVQAGPPEQRLSLLHVDDLVSAINSWISATTQCLHKTYAIDDGTVGGYSWTAIGAAINEDKLRKLQLPRSLLNLAARANLLMARMFGFMPMLTPGKVNELTEPEWLCDNSKFTQATNWKPVLDLSLGARSLFETAAKS